MSDKRSGKPPSEAHDRHHAELRRKRREASRASGARRPPQPDELPEGRVYLYGLHTVRHALANPRRRRHVLMATRNALARLDADPSWLAGVEVREVEPDRIARLLPQEAVHQGVLLEAEPLPVRSLRELSASPLLLVLDQVTDPHNVGAIMRSAVALGAGALITTNRHSPAESGVLAKSASGALDMIEHVGVRNLAEALQELAGFGYQTVGLDSDGPQTIENSLQSTKIALVLGAEGKGLRQKTRETCTTLARIDLPGEIRSLNVSNAAVLALYIARRHIDAQA
jgi:23S rRNA (guanosine2251-2'-O)-methyltransferase